MGEIIFAKTDEEYTAASFLFKEYAEWLNIDLGFQNFQKELSDLKKMYGINGGIILYKQDQEYLACVAIRHNTDEIAELKRMYVKPEVQRKGIARLLLDHAIQLAISKGYSYIRLDTLDNMTPAINLYKSYGFYEIPAYYYNPQNNAVFFEKRL